VRRKPADPPVEGVRQWLSGHRATARPNDFTARLSVKEYTVACGTAARRTFTITLGWWPALPRVTGRSRASWLLCCCFPLPILAISIHVFGLVPERTTAVVVILPLAAALAALITCVPSRIDAIILRGLIVGMVACAAYDAFRLAAVYALGWMGDFIPTMGSWVTGDPHGTGNAVVGYVWRYLGDGGGLGVCFFIVAFALGRDRFGRPSSVILAATGYAVFPVWAGLIATVALAPHGQELMFHLTASSVMITLIGHLIFGVALGLGFVRLRGIWESGTWPFPPLFRKLLQGSARRRIAKDPALVPALATATNT
jgi:hypothetical protein